MGDASQAALKAGFRRCWIDLEDPICIRWNNSLLQQIGNRLPVKATKSSVVLAIEIHACQTQALLHARLLQCTDNRRKKQMRSQPHLKCLLSEVSRLGSSEQVGM